MAKKRVMVQRVVPALPKDAELSPAPAQQYFVEGPLEEARDVETPWGTARAEAGCYVLEDEQTGGLHVVPEQDFDLFYARPG